MKSAQHNAWVLTILLIGSLSVQTTYAQLQVRSLRLGSGMWDFPPRYSCCHAIENLGDINDDGFLEFAVGRGSRESLTSRISLWSIQGNNDPRINLTDGHELNEWLLVGRDNSFFGCSIARVGDLDGDGATEMAVGSCVEDWIGFDGGPVRAAGSLSLVSWTDGKTILLQDNPASAAIPEYSRADAEFGASLVVIQQASDQSRLQLAVGAPGENALYLVEPHMSGSSTVARINLPDAIRSGRLGASVASIADLDGTGETVLAVGAPEAGATGALQLLFRNSPTEVHRWVEIRQGMGGFEGDLDAGDLFGAAVSVAHLNGDSVPDLLVGAPGDDDGGTDCGAVWLLLLSPGGTVLSQAKISRSLSDVYVPLQAGSRFGSSIEYAEGLDGNERNDIVVGAPGQYSAWLLYDIPQLPLAAAANVNITPSLPGAGQSVAIRGHWGTGVRDPLLYFKRAGSADIFVTSMSPALSEYGVTEGIIPSAAITSRGTEFAVEFQNLDGSTTRLPDERGFYSLPVRLENSTIEVRGDMRYSIISVPLIVDEPDARTILEKALGPYDRKVWRMFGIDHTTGGVIELPDEAFEFRPGVGFWLVSSTARRVATGTGITVATQSAFEHTLHEGYNLIGNPFNFSVPAGALQSDFVELLSFTEDGWEVPDSLRPGEGYAMYSPAESSEVSIHSASPSGVRKRQTADVDWIIHVSATDGLYVDAANAAISAPAATTEIDEHDRPEPPSVEGVLRVFFGDVEWPGGVRGSRIDARPSRDGGALWSLNVEPANNRPITISFQGLDTVPGDVEIKLVDPVAGDVISVRDQKTLWLGDMDASQRWSLLLVAGSPSFVQSNVRTVADFSVSPEPLVAYPNPFGESLSIRYSAEGSDRVFVEMLDVLGRVVREMGPLSHRETGRNTVTWTGLTSGQRRLAGGLYFIRVRTESVSASTAVVHIAH